MKIRLNASFSKEPFKKVVLECLLLIRNGMLTVSAAIICFAGVLAICFFIVNEYIANENPRFFLLITADIELFVFIVGMAGLLLGALPGGLIMVDYLRLCELQKRRASQMDAKQQREIQNQSL